jgi:ribonuclease HI
VVAKPTQQAVTVYADAAYHHAAAVGTYAVLIPGPSDVLGAGAIVAREAGECPAWVRDPNLAELYAILAGITLAAETYDVDALSRVRVWSDSRTAVRWCTRGNPLDGVWSREAARLRAQVFAWCAANDMRVTVRWIRGHAELPDGAVSRAHHQHDVDAAARAELGAILRSRGA